MSRENINRKLGAVCLILSVIFFGISLISALILRTQRDEFFQQNAMSLENHVVFTTDNARIEGVLYINQNDEGKTDKSVPTILLLNGINSRKEYHFKEAFNLVKRGYGVFSVEQRGHGLSDGPSGFLAKEPYDMIEVLDYMEQNFQFMDPKIGLLAFSYGGGIGAIVQAKDDRIHASVLYHPLSDLQGLLQRIPFQNLIGRTPAIEEVAENEDAISILNSSNTKNLLIIQGTEDTLILPEENQKLYEKINGPSRNDVQLELREGLDHFSNEEDDESFKHAIVWLEYFIKNREIDINNRDAEISKIMLQEFIYPDNPFSEIFIILSVFSLFGGLSLFCITLLIIPKWKERTPISLYKEKEDKNEEYWNMIKLRSIAYIVPVVGVGIFCAIFNASFVYGYLLIYPLVSIPLLLFIPSEIHSSWKQEWKYWVQNESQTFLYCMLIIFIPTFYFLVLFNLLSYIMIKPFIPFYDTSFYLYLIAGFGTFLLDFMYLREWKPRHTFIVIPLRIVSLLLFVIFVPLAPFPLLGGAFTLVLFFILTGVASFYLRQLTLVLSKYYKNSTLLYGFVLIPFVIFFVYIFFRIV